MWTLDIRTLFIVESIVLFLVGALLLLAALRGQRSRTLAWASTGMLLGGCGLLLNVLRLYPDWKDDIVILANMLLIMTHGSLWTSQRIFVGKEVRWAWLAAGPAAWFVLCLWPPFLGDTGLRVQAFSVVVILYLAATIHALWPERHQDGGAVMPVIGILGVHGLFYTYRLSLSPTPGTPWFLLPDFTIVMLESTIFAISLSFGILMMVRERAEHQYRYAALHDSLTSLPNRRALIEQGQAALSQCRHERQDLAVLMCDLDRFKRINDRLGHEAGDSALRQFARVLRQSVRSGDLCARIGGEEFVVLSPGLQPAAAADLAQRIRNKLSADAQAPAAALSVSIGIACASGTGYDLDQLLACADQALYQAKHAGRDCVRQWPLSAAE